MFGFHRRLVRRWEWETALPKPGFLPHTSQTAATSDTPSGVACAPTARPITLVAQDCVQDNGSVSGPPPYPRLLSRSVLQAMDAGEVRRWAAACVQALEAHREAIDRINVYPVADND